MQQEIARRCKYTIAVFPASNTVLLTCVRGQTPLRSLPAFSQIISAMADFRPGGQRPLRRDLARTAPFRVGISACFLACPAQKSVADMACITVSRYLLFAAASRQTEGASGARPRKAEQPVSSPRGKNHAQDRKHQRTRAQTRRKTGQAPAPKRRPPKTGDAPARKQGEIVHRLACGREGARLRDDPCIPYNIRFFAIWQVNFCRRTTIFAQFPQKQTLERTLKRLERFLSNCVSR